jgi:hypothetical protein
LELESAIQELLSRLEFVSLPGLGSFVKKYEPASLSADGKSFNPPREFFVFDTKRGFNDEALENFVAENSNLDHRKAAEIVVKFVEGVKSRLESNNEVSFPGVGVLRKGANGDLELVPSEDIISQTFGLGKIEVDTKPVEKKAVSPVSPVTKIEPKPIVKPEVKQAPAPKVESKKNVLVPVVVILALAAVALVFVFVPELRFWEGTDNVTQSQVAQVNPESGTGVIPSDSVKLEKDSLSQVVDTVTTQAIETDQSEKSSVIAVTDKKAALYYQETSQAESKTFYIVAGSFTQENNAQKLIEDLTKKGYKPILLQNNNVYRVAIYKFTNHDRALRELERLKAQKISDRVWLLSI